MWILEDQDPDEDRIHEKNVLKRQKEGFTKGSGKGWKNGFIRMRKRISDGSGKERKHGRKRNGYKEDVESSGEWKHGRERKGWREATGRMWRGVERRSMEGRGKDGERIL